LSVQLIEYINVLKKIRTLSITKKFTGTFVKNRA